MDTSNFHKAYSLPVNPFQEAQAAVSTYAEKNCINIYE